ncbi:hypothetical protein SAMN05660236_0809 [Ohtaekwangia koreensis]|uniref:Uncharacterized protein n=1 Tax=Ohtaekwangia koreensis TaxID=688867 RepID=A0A1T5J6S6_9BACT|nr:hypothetical protein SAMN05660236_0809 [Ohtaekwangia koreensis]
MYKIKSRPNRARPITTCIRNFFKTTMRLYFILILILLTGCEGLKVLTLTNVSGGNATVIVKPKIEEFDKNNIHNYPTGQLGDSLVISLPTDSSFVLLSTFTTMMFGSKIKPYDLRIDYLKIETKVDTITADSRQEILDLINDERTRYRPNTDRQMTNGKNFGNIMIR